MEKQKTILLVDDDEALAEAVQMILEDEGYQVEVAHASKYIDPIVSKKAPDLILLDYRLPDENGVTIASRLRTQPSTKDIPIVMVSASYSIQKPAMEAGANAFLPKPFAFDSLLDTIENFLNFNEVRAQ